MIEITKINLLGYNYIEIYAESGDYKLHIPRMLLDINSLKFDELINLEPFLQTRISMKIDCTYEGSLENDIIYEITKK